jgi:hypothetical protein
MGPRGAATATAAVAAKARSRSIYFMRIIVDEKKCLAAFIIVHCLSVVAAYVLAREH